MADLLSLPLVGASVTDVQKQLARHALGLPNTSRTSYRRYFISPVGTDSHTEWTLMVLAGDATKPNSPRSDLFLVTRQGAEAVLLPGEQLESGFTG